MSMRGDRWWSLNTTCVFMICGCTTPVFRVGYGDYLATEVGVPLSTANKFLDKLSEKIRSEVSQGSKVSIPGLGIFEASIRGERRQHNIATNKVGVVAGRILSSS